mmetsp:Transcript_47095/g.147715  ORF Transcript_47095/g.147715 Transcript_47095/m.147715 type:complete len:209 (+) Transcript_47095:78-704(+)
MRVQVRTLSRSANMTLSQPLLDLHLLVGPADALADVDGQVLALAEGLLVAAGPDHAPLLLGAGALLRGALRQRAADLRAARGLRSGGGEVRGRQALQDGKAERGVEAGRAGQRQQVVDVRRAHREQPQDEAGGERRITGPRLCQVESVLPLQGGKGARPRAAAEQHRGSVPGLLGEGGLLRGHPQQEGPRPRVGGDLLVEELGGLPNL